MKLYVAMIWKEPNKPGVRVSVEAESLGEAKAKLEAEFGAGTVFDLHNEDDAARAR